MFLYMQQTIVGPAAGEYICATASSEKKRYYKIVQQYLVHNTCMNDTNQNVVLPNIMPLQIPDCEISDLSLIHI